MKQTRSKNEFIKYWCEGNKSLQSKKKNCVCLVKKAKKDYFDNLDLKSVTDNKKFWKLGRHFLLIKKLIVIK